MSIIATILEMLSLGLIVPLLYALSSSTQSENAVIFGIAMHLFHITNLNLSNILWLLVIIFAAKNIFLLFLARSQAKFVFGVEESMSNRMYDIYLHQQFQFFLRHNSAQLLRNVMREPSQFAHNALSPLCLLVTEFFVSAGVILLLILVNPMGAITSFILFGGVGYIFYALIHRKITIWGVEHQFHEGKRLQNLQEGFGSIKEILIGSLQGNFISAYSLHMHAGAKSGINQQSVQSAPRLFIEIFAVLVLALTVAFFSESEPMTLLPIIGLYAAAAFRLMPSVNRIINALQSLRYSEATVHLLAGELARNNLVKSSKASIGSFEKTIELRNISFQYDPESSLLFKNANLMINKGDVIFLSGSSGSGKTTLVDIICGLLRPTNGMILIDGINIESDISSWQQHIAYVPQTTFLLDGSIRENIIFGSSQSTVDENRLIQVCQVAEIDEILAKLPVGLDSMVGERGSNLSGGQRQRIGLARALYRGGSILILDEATNALDTKLELRIVRNILEFTSGVTKIWITHNTNLLNTAQKVLLENQSIRKI